MRRRLTKCDGCGGKFLRRETIKTSYRADGVRFREGDKIVKRRLCATCMRVGELPPPITLVRSCWAPWDEQPVIPNGDLLYPQLVHHKGAARCGS